MCTVAKSMRVFQFDTCCVCLQSCAHFFWEFKFSKFLVLSYVSIAKRNCCFLAECLNSFYMHRSSKFNFRALFAMDPGQFKKQVATTSTRRDCQALASPSVQGACFNNCNIEESGQAASRKSLHGRFQYVSLSRAHHQSSPLLMGLLPGL